MHSVGWVDSSGFRHVKIQPSSEAPSPESLEEQIDENLLVRQQRPSQSGLKRFSLSAILFHLVRSMVRLVKQICHKAPPEITQGLYEEILLGMSSKAIKGATESETLEFLCNFLKKSPHLKDEVVLKELSQAATWAKQLENAPVLLIEKVKNNITKNIVETLRGLKTGEGCVLPGGALATFRITKTSEKTCNLELFSRHPDFPGVESVEAGGKQKVRGCVFQGLSLEELTQPIWIESFLQATQTGNPDSYNAVLANFTACMIPSQESRIPFHASKEALCRVQNVWDMVHATSSSKQRMHRRKLSLQLEALYGFFQQQKADLKPDSVAFLYLKEGVNKVAKTTLAVGADLTSDEKAKIEADLAAIDTYLNTLSPQPQKLSITSPKNAALFLATPGVKTDTPSISPTMLPPTAASPLPIRAYPTENAEYELAAQCDLSTRKACIDALTALQNEIVKGALSPAEEIQKITQLCLLLPLTPSPTMHDYKQNKVLKQNWDHQKIAEEDIWYTSESNADAIKEVEEVSTLLTDLSSRLYTSNSRWAHEAVVC